MGHEVRSNNGQRPREREGGREEREFKLRSSFDRGSNFVRACHDLFEKNYSLRSKLRSFELASSTSCVSYPLGIVQSTTTILQRRPADDFPDNTTIKALSGLKIILKTRGRGQTPFESIQDSLSLSLGFCLPFDPDPIRESPNFRSAYRNESL